MTEKELKKQKRAELLEELLTQMRRAERLEEENARLRERIADRERSLAQAGALAEAALRLGGTGGASAEPRRAAISAAELENAGRLAQAGALALRVARLTLRMARLASLRPKKDRRAAD